MLTEGSWLVPIVETGLGNHLISKNVIALFEITHTFASCTDFPRLLVFGLRATACEEASVARLISCYSPVTIQVVYRLHFYNPVQ